MTDNPHFVAAASWKAAETMLTFHPVYPRETLGHRLQSIRIHVRDHKLRELPTRDRTLEAHYGAFVLSEMRKGVDEARRSVIDVRYGQDPRETRIAGHEARTYELGPEPPPDDIDGRSPSVVVWRDGEMVFFIASAEMPVADLVKIASSMY